MSGIANHLWQSTLFGAFVALVALVLRSNQAKTRYWLWLAASVKFLIPFSLFISLGTRVESPTVRPVISAIAVEQITTSFAPVSTVHSSRRLLRTGWPQAIAAVWFLGTMTLMAVWLRRWFTIRESLRGACRLPAIAPIPAFSSHSSIEPGVFGIFRPVLLLPEGIMNHLSALQLDAIVAHEMSHVRRRDNLTAAVHMFIQALFWYHPLVWWIGGKLVEERERACDEAVLERGSRPQVYAQGILNVCKYYTESPLACASGVTGADLRKRIEEILLNRTTLRLTMGRKLILTFVLFAGLAVPFVIGFLRAQTLPPPPRHKFEVASIRPGDPASQQTRIGPGPQGGLRTQDTTVLQLISFAYDLREFQIVGGPGWIRSERFNVTGTPDTPEDAPSPALAREKLESMFSRHRERMQALLLERFGMVLRAETRDMPVYGLTLVNNGHKLTISPDDKKPNMSSHPGVITARSVDTKMLTATLSAILGRPVIDETGLKGHYDFKLQWTPDSQSGEPVPADEVGPSIFTSVQEQLGLKLAAKKAPAPVYVIEKIERPSEN